MKSSLVVLVLATSLCGFFYSRMTATNGALQEQQKQIRSLEEKLAAKTHTELLEVQDRCAKQAMHTFTADGNKLGGFTDFQNHYNAELKKCFMVITANDYNTNRGQVTTVKTLGDAYERKVFGEYAWVIR